MRASRLISATLAALLVASPAMAEPVAEAATAVLPVAPATQAATAAPAAAPAPEADPALAPGAAPLPAVTPAPVQATLPQEAIAVPTAAEGTATAVPAEQAAAPEPPPPPPEPTLVIDINLSIQRMTVSENGAAKHTWAISSAAPGYRTPTGTFKPSWMSRMWYSRQYDWSPMPHSIFFHNGVAIHATQAIRQLGRPASHGCVRLAPSNAASLYKMVTRHGKSMTKIVVHGTPRHAPAVSYRTSGPRYGYRAGSRRGAPSYYAYNTPPQYYVAAPRRRASASYPMPKPRRYVSRGFMQGQYGY